MINEQFEIIKSLFKEKNNKLFMIGSFSRDFLLERPINDFDLATSLTPEEVIEMIKCKYDIDDSFIKYGVIKAKIEGFSFTFVTMRKEKQYEDFRHPSSITFTKDMFIDSQRRDFTINALYINSAYQVIDYHRGLVDLKNKVIRTIGEPLIRIQEDPLRILRALRFKEKYNFKLDPSLEEAIYKNIDLLKKLKKEKIAEEITKFENKEKIAEWLKNNEIL